MLLLLPALTPALHPPHRRQPTNTPVHRPASGLIRSASNNPNSTTQDTHLQIPALVTDANNNSVFECWQLEPSILSAQFPGPKGFQVVDEISFGLVEEAEYWVLPPGFDGGLLSTGVPALIHVVSGLMRTALSHDPSTVGWLVGGVAGAMILADMMGSGHQVSYPTDESTVILWLPFKDGMLPEYTVLGQGVCSTNLGALV
ncbi:MAG: hypothetical protein M1820_007275 [Bogoriella megaspora]|nr:MAG: hypothetical protein M1820_007275 [Bogoriella megaspora]